MIHRVEPQIQEVETRQRGYGGKGIVVHQAVARQVELPRAEDYKNMLKKCCYLMQGSLCIPSNCSSRLYERERVVRGASGCISGGRCSWLKERRRVER